MSGQTTSSPGMAPRVAHPDRLVRRAWIALAFYPVSFVVSFVVGELLLSWYGYTDEESVPFWIAVGAAGPALLLFSVPGVVAVHFGRRAVHEGNQGGLTPAVVGAVIALGVIGLNVVSGLATAFLG